MGDQAIDSAKRIQSLFEEDLRQIQNTSTAKALEVYLFFQNNPISSVSEATKAINASNPTIYKAVGDLEALEILVEVSGKERGKVYVYKKYFEILYEGTEPL